MTTFKDIAHEIFDLIQISKDINSSSELSNIVENHLKKYSENGLPLTKTAKIEILTFVKSVKLYQKSANSSIVDLQNEVEELLKKYR